MKRRSNFLTDFKDFVNKGNVVDLAVAVVIGGAFGKVVDAVVSLVMTSLLAPALKAANVSAISAGDFQESCHSLAAIQAAWIKGSARSGSGSSVGLFIHTSAG